MMTLKEVMECRHFVIVGDTRSEEKYAFRIKTAMVKAGYQVEAVGKELASLNDTAGDPEIIDLCIHPAKGLKLLRECRKPIKGVVIQPGAESPELVNWLEESRIPFIESCLLKGLKEYRDL